MASCLPSPAHQPLIDPLSQRELEVLHLIAQGLSNQEISERLFLALSTVKGHNLKSLANCKSNGAPKRSPAPASWVCCSQSLQTWSITSRKARARQYL